MKFDAIIHNANDIQDIFSDPLENDAIQIDGLAVAPLAGGVD